MVSFKQAFDAARKAGNRYFSWNGNDYNTMTKEEQNSGIGDYFSKFKGNVGDNSNFQKAASNMGSQMMGVFQNPTKGKYAGQDYNIGIYFKPQFNSPATNQLIDQATIPPSTQKITSINAPINNFNRSQVRAFMSSRGLDPYAYTGGQRKALRKALNSGQDVEAIFKQWSQDNQPISYNAEGGLLKFDDGGTMEDFKKWLNQKLRKGELEESDLSKEKLAQLYQTFKKEQQGVQTAMNGAKLNYINQLMVNVLRGHIYHIIEQEEHCVKSVKLMLIMKVLILLKLLNRNVAVRLKRKNQVVRQIIKNLNQ